MREDFCSSVRASLQLARLAGEGGEEEKEEEEEGTAASTSEHTNVIYGVTYKQLCWTRPLLSISLFDIYVSRFKLLSLSFNN